MSIRTVRECDGCGVLYTTTNNWWCAVDNGHGGLAFSTFEQAEALRVEERRDYCSHKCVVSAFNNWLDNVRTTERMEQ